MGPLIIFSVIIEVYAYMTLSSLLDEAWNCANPRPYPKKKYEVCQWTELDLAEHKGHWFLRPRVENDTAIKKKIRKIYWKKRGYDVTKIRLR